MPTTEATVAPRLVTQRLVLRQLEARDFEPFAEQFTSAEAMAPLSPLADRRAAWQKLASLVGMWTLSNAGWWGVELRETNELAGTVGAFFRESGGDLEIGWTVFPRFRRRGIAVEAARAALAHGFSTHNAVTRAIAHVDAPNIASVRVCESLGMSLEGDVDFYGTRLMRYAIARV